MSDASTSEAPWEYDQPQPAPPDEAISVRSDGAAEASTAVADEDGSVSVTEHEAPVDQTGEETAPKRKRQNLRPRGWLELDVKSITDRFVTGEITLPEGQHMTPHRVAQLVKDLESLDEPPSSGAVAAVFKRWDELGFAQIGTKPVAFIDYTDEGRSVGLSALKEQRQASIKKIRAAAKETATESGDTVSVSSDDSAAVGAETA